MRTALQAVMSMDEKIALEKAKSAAQVRNKSRLVLMFTPPFKIKMIVA
jgi:hypothetical protein